MNEKAKIQIEENSLENLILLGKDKLINIEIDYPTENGRVKASAKITQLTMEELKNLDITTPNLKTNLEILSKSLFKQDDTPFEKELLLELPVGVVNAVSEKILEISGVDTDLKKH